MLNNYFYMFLPLNFVSSGYVCNAGPAPIAPIYNSAVCMLFPYFTFTFEHIQQGGKMVEICAIQYLIRLKFASPLN